MNCANCGAAVSIDQKFCANCGTKVQLTTESKTLTQKLLGPYPIAAGIGLVIFIIFMGFKFFNSNGLSIGKISGEWRSEGEADYNLFQFNGDSTFSQHIYEQGKLVIRTVGTFQINNNRLNLCARMNYFHHPDHEKKEMPGGNCSNGKPDGWIEINEIGKDYFSTTVRGTFRRQYH